MKPKTRLTCRYCNEPIQNFIEQVNHLCSKSHDHWDPNYTRRNNRLRKKQKEQLLVESKLK